MNSHVTKWIGIALAGCGFAILVCGKAISGEMANEINPAERSARHSAGRASGQTLTNICAELIHLSGQFRILAGISATNIVTCQADRPGNQNWVHHHLRLFKNVKVDQVRVEPGQKGTLPESNERHTIERDGVKLEIYLLQYDINVARTHDYLLPYGTGNNQLRLIYYLKENPRDPALEKAVQDVIERNVALLRKSLQTP